MPGRPTPYSDIFYLLAAPMKNMRRLRIKQRESPETDSEAEICASRKSDLFEYETAPQFAPNA